MKVLESSLEKLAKSIAKRTPIRVTFFGQKGSTNENNKKAADYIRTAAKPMILKYWKNSFYLGRFWLFYPAISWRDVWPWLWNKLRQPFIIRLRFS
jgi:hypothetical protein